MHEREWIHWAVQTIEADFNRSSDTHLLPLRLPAFPNIHLYFKDESSHPTGSLKHRLARSLFLFFLCNGWIKSSSTIVEASSGSTAISEAYFARLLGLKFVAVIPEATSPEKIECIEFYGGVCHLVKRLEDVEPECLRVVREEQGVFLDQFTFAERATDWRGNNNIAESLFNQMKLEPYPIPKYIVCGAGTGGTSATLGRYCRYQRFQTSVWVADPEYSVFFAHFSDGNKNHISSTMSLIQGIGRPKVEKSFIPEVIDGMTKVPDSCSLAACHQISSLLKRRYGGSSGTIWYTALQLVAKMNAQNQSGSIVCLLCDDGERYKTSYFCKQWLLKNNFSLDSLIADLDNFINLGINPQWLGSHSIGLTSHEHLLPLFDNKSKFFSKQ
jgi:cysteine synthase